MSVIGLEKHILKHNKTCQIPGIGNTFILKHTFFVAFQSRRSLCIDDNISLGPDIDDCTDEDLIYRASDFSKPSKRSIYTSYFSAGTNIYILLGCLVLFAMAQIIASMCDYWVSYW